MSVDSFYHFCWPASRHCIYISETKFFSYAFSSKICLAKDLFDHNPMFSNVVAICCAILSRIHFEDLYLLGYICSNGNPDAKTFPIVNSLAGNRA